MAEVQRLIWYFIFFFVSGFCSVLYELVWLRLSMAQFGVTTAMVSIVLSVFMAGLGLGSWISGRWLRDPDSTISRAALRTYAIIECLIGISGIVVPYALVWGGHVLGNTGLLSSFTFYVAAGLWVALTLIPWCCLMGATIPVAMRAIRQSLPAESSRSFSYLYMANVAGAVAGTTLPLLLIELFGFRGTLRVGTVCNFLIGISALALSAKGVQKFSATELSSEPIRPASTDGNTNTLFFLFLTGLTSMAMEVVWVRRYTPFLGTVVYAFAAILCIYLVATLLGSVIYRRWSAQARQESPVLWIWLASTALLPLMAANPNVGIPEGSEVAAQIGFSSILRLVVGIAPFTGLLGLITPMLVDRYSGGDSTRAGKAYAINVAGCILGPLVAGFGLLPFLPERWALVLLTLPWIVIGLAPLVPSRKSQLHTRVGVYVSLALAVSLISGGRGIDEDYNHRRVLRDSTATVIATGTGFDRQLLVNGYGMTSLTPITKVMAHFPLATLDRAPQNALVICFGMGTTFRALHSWGIPVTAVELVPSVPKMFSYYHDDADQVMQSPLSHVVIDDGRRFLQRTREQFDLITIDPPPPLQAAASSLLYSEDFYRVARMRLRPGGILQQWVPTTSDEHLVDTVAVARSVRDSFPYVRVFGDEFGLHFLCSDRPLPVRNAFQLVARMPGAAIIDFVEWERPLPEGPMAEASVKFAGLLQQEIDLDRLIAASPDTPAITDDRPINEYYVLRRLRRGETSTAPQRED